MDDKINLGNKEGISVVEINQYVCNMGNLGEVGQISLISIEYLIQIVIGYKIRKVF